MQLVSNSKTWVQPVYYFINVRPEQCEKTYNYNCSFTRQARSLGADMFPSWCSVGHDSLSVARRRRWWRFLYWNTSTTAGRWCLLTGWGLRFLWGRASSGRAVGGPGWRCRTGQWMTRGSHRKFGFCMGIRFIIACTDGGRLISGCRGRLGKWPDRNHGFWPWVDSWGRCVSTA